MIRLKISEIDDNSIAKNIGLRVGDILDSYDGNVLYDITELINSINNANNSTSHILVVIRDSVFSSIECEHGRLGISVTPTEIDDSEYHKALKVYRETIQQDTPAQDDELDIWTKSKNITLTTTPHLDGFICKPIDIITAECVYGMNIFKDFFAGMSDVFGGRNRSTQATLRNARVVCLNELRMEAARIGADAVIGVSLDYSEFSGGGKSMLFLVASGTAVHTIQYSQNSDSDLACAG